MKKFETLYKLTSTGASQMWEVSVSGTTITTKHGKVGGKLIESVEIIKEGKNLGKKNETTPEEQALLEAEATWTGKLKKGYVKDLKDAKEGKTDSIIEGGMLPMLAHKYSEQAEKIIYPALAQPKLDGHRMVAIREKRVWGLWSRTRKPIKGLDHIIKALDEYTLSGGEEFIFDGEAYNHDYKAKFEELTHFIKQPKTIPGSEIVQFHIYDIGHPGLRQSQRSAFLDNIKTNLPKTSPLKVVFTCEVDTEESLMTAFEEFTKAGYEGAMIRNMFGLYENKRSINLQKVKEFQEIDCIITGVKEGKGIMEGRAIFTVKTPDGIEVDVKMKGVLADLEKYFKNPKLALNKVLEVKYQGYTKTKSLRFPVGMRIKIEI